MRYVYKSALRARVENCCVTASPFALHMETLMFLSSLCDAALLVSSDNDKCFCAIAGWLNVQKLGRQVKKALHIDPCINSLFPSKP